MSEAVDGLVRLLAQWPIVLQFAGVVLIAYVVIFAMRRGERDRKENGNSNGGGSASYRMNKAFDGIDDIKNFQERSLEVLKEISGEVRQQTQLLEQIANENIINPRRLRE